jgi:xanthosine utilization system XapX-like protein
MMLNFLMKYKNYLIGIALGALAGFLYWRFIGCNSGTCPITSTWHNSTLYGALMGALFANSGKKKKAVKDTGKS